VRAKARADPLHRAVREGQAHGHLFTPLALPGCGYIYDEALGLPEQGIAPGTRFEDVPEDAFYCPDCGTEKQDFELMDY
jgi:rubredoxin